MRQWAQLSLRVLMSEMWQLHFKTVNERKNFLKIRGNTDVVLPQFTIHILYLIVNWYEAFIRPLRTTRKDFDFKRQMG